MSSFKDFAVGQVATAPSPATSGTTLVLGSGQGSRMPTPPFYATATPPGTIPSLDVSEIVKVTNVAGNTLTIVRAQKGTSAKSIAANWLFVNAIYADDMFSSSITMDEALTGAVNGSNQVFTTATSFSSIDVYKNGVRMHVGDDFTKTGDNQITFITPPATGTKLTATYITGSQVMISGGNSIVTKETPSGLVNGINQGYATTNPYVPGSLQVYINGLAQGSLVTESDPSLGTFFLDTAPLTGDNLQVSYQFVTGVTGNADTVDGYHASATPTANTILPLNSSGKYGLNQMPSVPKRDITTDGTITNPKIQTGWAYLTGSGGANSSVTVTFPEAFSSLPYVQVSAIGYKSGSNPTSVNDIVDAVGWPINARTISTSSFTATYSQASGTLANTIRVSFFWYAIGEA